MIKLQKIVNAEGYSGITAKDFKVHPTGIIILVSEYGRPDKQNKINQARQVIS